MKLTKLQDKWAAGQNALNGWCSIPSSVTAEIMAGYDFDSLTIDPQHGLVDYQTALTMFPGYDSIWGYPYGPRALE